MIFERQKVARVLSSYTIDDCPYESLDFKAQEDQRPQVMPVVQILSEDRGGDVAETRSERGAFTAASSFSFIG